MLYALGGYGEDGVARLMDSESPPFLPLSFLSFPFCSSKQRPLYEPTGSSSTCEAKEKGLTDPVYINTVLKDELETAMRLVGITALDQAHPGLVNTREVDGLVPEVEGRHEYARDWRRAVVKSVL